MRIPFWKMHGAGNDFILVEDTDATFPCNDPDWLTSVAHRRTGVGCEGILLIQRSACADFRMKFFNPDGREAPMCGNGARCVARLAHELGLAPPAMTIETGAGRLRADIRGELVLLEMPAPKAWVIEAELSVGDRTIRYGFVNTGVPHAVVLPTGTLAACDVQGLGAAIRHHPVFAPEGANVNFIAVTGPHALHVRTYERGVEGETLACGTGITAAALVTARQGLTQPPVDVSTAGGDTLTVDFRLRPDSAEQVTLLGPAVHVFHGELTYPGGGCSEGCRA